MRSFVLPPRDWVRADAPVDRASYFGTGVVLLAVKYAIEATLVFAVAGRRWPVWAFLSPLATTRFDVLEEDSSTLLVALAALSLPFLIVGLSMSVRRADDAGLTPFLGLLFAVPVLNYVAMTVLSALPSRPSAPKAVPPGEVAPPTLVRVATASILGAAAIGLLAAGVAAWSAAYGAIVFFAAPVGMGAIVGYFVNRRVDHGLSTTMTLTALAGVITSTSLLLFGLEGAICVVMALPIGLLAMLLGAAIGRQVARVGGHPGGAALCIALPLLAIGEGALDDRPLHHVATAVIVEAPADVVFDHVVSFSPITEAAPWYFRAGIATPLRARIDGTGVGAVRHCEFTTGAFVEPITAWEPGRRLAFDVTSSPPPMEEWSPYRHLHPPHLDTTMRSRRGEFRLVPLDDGRTRLEGHTYYDLGIGPDAYFAWIADAVVQRIHLRVLEHVAREAEADPRRLADVRD